MPSNMPSWRLALFLAAPVLALGGCQSVSTVSDRYAAILGLGDDTPKAYTASAVSEAKRSGAAVADEPLAARAGASVLAAGGSAADAVSAMFFTLTATYPVAAGLGGGGICLVREPSGQVTEFDFLTRAPARQGAYAVPGAVRGFADMQKQFGALPWQRIVAPGEAFAATGFPVSQALHARLVAAQNVVRLDAALAAEFLDESGQPRAVASEVKNVPLSLTLGQVRISGADGFFRGAVAGRIESWSLGQAGAVTVDELASVKSVVGPARSRAIGGFSVAMPGARTGAGAFNASLMDNLSRVRGRGIAGAVTQTLSTFNVTSLPADMGSTGFSAVDAGGEATSCVVTMNGPFGAGRTAGDTGVLLASNPAGGYGLASAFLSPLIASGGDGAVLAASGAGGPNGTAAAINAVLDAAGGRPLGKRGDLRGTGNAPYDTVNVISCDSEACVAFSDPGANGAGAVAETAALQ
jgi:gamma-glutamyltranspeptidase/glutathione hydrolase